MVVPLRLFALMSLLCWDCFKEPFVSSDENVIKYRKWKENESDY